MISHQKFSIYIYQSYPIRAPSHDWFQSQVVDFINGQHVHLLIMWGVGSGSGNWMERQWVSCTRGNSFGTNVGGWTMLPQMLGLEMDPKRGCVLWWSEVYADQKIVLNHTQSFSTKAFMLQSREEVLFPLSFACMAVPLFFPRASERRVLPIVRVCISSSHLHSFSSSHLLIFTASHLLIFTSSSSSHHLHIFTSSHLHIFSSHLLIFAPSHLHTFSSSQLHIFSSSHLHIFTSSHLHIRTYSHPHIFTSSHLHIFTSAHIHILTSSHLHICSSSHLLIFTSLLFSHLNIFTSAHLHICSSSHLLIFTPSHLHIFSSSQLLIFTSAHLHICSSSHLLIFTSAHLHIFSSSHPHIFTSSHLHIFSSCPLALLLSPSFSISLLKAGAGQCKRDGTNATLSHEMKVDRQKLRKNCDFTCPGATLSHETRVDRQKLM